MKTAVVIYAAKSTEDKRGSIADQLKDCREFAEREGWEIVGEFTDENKSAYHGRPRAGARRRQGGRRRHRGRARLVQFPRPGVRSVRSRRRRCAGCR